MRHLTALTLLALTLSAPQARAQKTGAVRVVAPVGIPSGIGAAGAAVQPTLHPTLPTLALPGVSSLRPGLAIPSVLPAAVVPALAAPAAAIALRPAIAANPVDEPAAKPAEPGARGRLDAAAGQAKDLPTAKTAEAGKGAAGAVFDQGAVPVPAADAVPAGPDSELHRLRRENAELRQRLSEKDQLVARVVHDLRNPLTPVDGFAQLLETDGPLSERQKGYVARIRKAAARLGGMLSDLLDLSRAQGAPLKTAPVDLGRIVQETAAALSAGAAQRGISLDVKVGQGAVVFGDEALLLRVVENLVSNGIKYNKDGGRLTIKVEPGPGGVTLTFADEGIGVAEGDIPKLFTPFFRTDAARAARPGNGLGLSSVKSAVERHGGRIDVHSVVGQGTSFKVFLPKARPAAPAPGPMNGVTQAAGDLRTLAAPWRTRTQLGRLEAAQRAPDESFTFAVVGDAEPGRFFFSRWLWGKKGVFQRHLEMIERDAPDFVIQLGDMVSRPKPRNLLAFFRDLVASGLTRPFLTVIGNHDRRKPHGVTDSESYRSHFGATNYAFDRGGARFVVLDTSAGMLSPRQLGWLDRQLDTPDRKLVFTHMAPVTPETIAATHPAMKNGGFTQGAPEFVDIVSRRGVDRVYFGHLHGFATLVLRGVRYVLTGGGGSPLFPIPWVQRFYHHIMVTVGPDGVSDSVRRLDGTGFPVEP